MPLIRISLRAGKPADYRRAIAENIYELLRETFNVPEKDFFASVDELEPHDIISSSMTATTSTSSAVTIWCSFNYFEQLELKKPLYRRIVEQLGKSQGLRPQDEGELVVRQRGAAIRLKPRRRGSNRVATRG